MSAAQAMSAGSVLAGKYRVTRLLGQGGMGVVVEAQHISLEDRVALKFLLPEYASHPQAAERFLREARAAVKIKGAHVARVSDVGALEDGSPYMVMEYLEGSDAAKLLATQGPLPLPEAIDWIVQASDAIAEAHALGIVHRDLKPANLFVTRHQDGTPFIKVLDFGISKLISDTGEALTRTNASMGSALYMSPEQIRQARSVDHRTDVYALGITLFELLTGRQPFSGESFSALCVEIATGTPTPLTAFRQDLPPDFVRVLEKAYARDPAHRYQGIGELVSALTPWALPRTRPIIERIARSAGMAPAEPVLAPPPPLTTRPIYLPPAQPKKSSSVPVFVLLGGVGVVIVAVIGAGIVASQLLASPSPAATSSAIETTAAATVTESPNEPGEPAGNNPAVAPAKGAKGPSTPATEKPAAGAGAKDPVATESPSVVDAGAPSTKGIATSTVKRGIATSTPKVEPKPEATFNPNITKKIQPPQ